MPLHIPIYKRIGKVGSSMSTQQNPNVQLTFSGILFTMLLIASIIGTCILIFTRTGEASGSALNLFAKGNIMPLIATPTPIVSAIPQITPTSEVGGGIVTTA